MATLAELRAMVNRKLRNFESFGSTTDTMDGIESIYVLPEDNVNADTLTVALDGENTTEYTLEGSDSVIVFTTAPPVDTVVTTSYRARHYSNDMLLDAINFSIASLYPNYAYALVEDDSFEAVQGTYEYDLSGTESVCDQIISVEIEEVSGVWVKQSAWRTAGVPGALRIHFQRSPVTGAMRVVYRTGFLPLADDGDDLTSDSLVPDHLKEAVVLGACLILITDTIMPRVRSDVAVSTLGEDAVNVYELERAIGRLDAAYQLKLRALKMRPYARRAVYNG